MISLRTRSKRRATRRYSRAVRFALSSETPGVPELDQVNFVLPASWSAARQTEFALLVDGLAANNVILSLRAPD